jgi:hypothetical protein
VARKAEPRLRVDQDNCSSLTTGRQELAIGSLDERATRDGTLRQARSCQSVLDGPPGGRRNRIARVPRSFFESEFVLQRSVDGDRRRCSISGPAVTATHREPEGVPRRCAAPPAASSGNDGTWTSWIGVMPMAAATMQWAANVTSVAKTATASVRSSSTASQPCKACAAAHYWTSGLRNSDTRLV